MTESIPIVDVVGEGDVAMVGSMVFMNFNDGVGMINVRTIGVSEHT